MVRMGNLAIFESSNISETREVTPTKIGVHVCDINSYLHEFFELIPIDSIWSEGEIWPFLRVAVTLKPERSRPPKLVYLYVTSIPTCMNFLSQFRSIKFFDDHGL